MKQLTCIIVIVSALLAVITGVRAQEPVEFSKDRYRHSFDAASVQHPERIYYIISYKDVRLEFRLPYEQDRSGVANLLLRETASGIVHLLDTVKINPSYDPAAEVPFHQLIGRIDEIKRPHIRAFNGLKPGNYDVILLYNNGKYLVYDHLVLADEMKMIVDMSSLPVQKADRQSREWLELRKFTDEVGGTRSVIKGSPTTSPYKFAGYVFSSYWGEAYSGSPSIRFAESGEFSSRASEDGYFEVDLPGRDTTYALQFYYGSTDYYDELDAQADTWLIYARGGEWPRERKRAKVGGEESHYRKRRYEHVFPPDSTWLWHPEQFHIAVPDMKVDFIFPYENEQSGVANLLFRNRTSGEIRLLDYEKRPEPYLASERKYRPFDPGGYDAILLYNNGNYVIRENVILEPGVKMAVDMSFLPVQGVDEDSRQWLDQRKFTDEIADRRILRGYYRGNDPRRKISGYIFGGESPILCSVRLPAQLTKEASTTKWDGYFEFDYEDSDVGLTLRISDDRYYKDLDIELTPNSGYFIVLEPEIVPTPKIIGKGGRVKRGSITR